MGAITVAPVARQAGLTLIPVGTEKWCFGSVQFTAADQYTAGGIDLRTSIRKQFGVNEVFAIVFLGQSCDAGMGGNGCAANPRYDFTSGMMKLYGIGRNTNSTNGPKSETEVTGTSINNLLIPFWAICRGEGRTSDQNS